MGDRSGNIRWWDVTTGQSSSFNTHREGIRRIKFSPVVTGDHSRGRIAVLFYDNTFTVFDLVSIQKKKTEFINFHISSLNVMVHSDTLIGSVLYDFKKWEPRIFCEWRYY